MIKYECDNNEKDNANSQLANGHLTNGRFVLPLVKQHLIDDMLKRSIFIENNNHEIQENDKNNKANS